MDPLTDSVVAVSAASMRPDIQEAKYAADKIKEKLTYNNSDELTTGMQKVQPLPFLDEEIKKHHQQIENSVPEVEQATDDIPAKVLGQVEAIMELAKTGETGLFKASQLLEFTMDAYSYAREAQQDTFDLERGSEEALSKYDQTFHKLIEGRIKSETESDAELLDNCFRCLDKAVRDADEDCDRLKSRMASEDQEITADILKEMHEQVQEMIDVEKSELDMIKDQCSTDINTVDSELHALNQRMQESFKDHKHHEFERKRALEANRSEQVQLEARLKQLKNEERRLVTEVQTGETLQKEAECALDNAFRNIQDWQGQISELQKRTFTALQIMVKMSECTDVIMRDAKSYKENWTKRLEDLELEALLTKRDTLMAQGALYHMVASDSSRNLDCLKKELKDLDRSKKDAAKTGWTKKVKDMKEKMEECDHDITNYKTKVDDNNRKLAGVKATLAETDKHILILKPLKLDSLEDRSKRRRAAMDQAFEVGSAKDANFHSKYKYGN